MSAIRLSTPRLIVAAAACSTMLAIGVPSAFGVADSDRQGYVDSTARCPDTAVVFGSTQSSRIAICKTANGYEYRGVRVRDGAKLIAPASQSGSGQFVATSGGTTYTVSSSTLSVSVGGDVIQSEPMLDFHEPQAPAASAPAPATAPSTSTTPTTPIKPLPAEVGGSGR